MIRDNNFYLDTPTIDGLEDFKLYGLINDDGSGWDMNLLAKLFLPSDVVDIARIPLAFLDERI